MKRRFRFAGKVKPVSQYPAFICRTEQKAERKIPVDLSKCLPAVCHQIATIRLRSSNSDKSRGGGASPGAPQEGWDHSVPFLPRPFGADVFGGDVTLTGNLTLPGRFLILQPHGQGVNISRRINAESERNRLRALGVLIKPPGAGLLIRTEAEGVSEELLIDDLEALLR